MILMFLATKPIIFLHLTLLHVFNSHSWNPTNFLSIYSVIFSFCFLPSIHETTYYVWNSKKKGYIRSRNPIRINHTEVVYTLTSTGPVFMGCGNIAFKDDEKSVHMCFCCNYSNESSCLLFIRSINIQIWQDRKCIG